MSFGMNGIWWAFFAADLISSLVSIVVYRYEMKVIDQQILQQHLNFV